MDRFYNKTKVKIKFDFETIMFKLIYLIVSKSNFILTLVLF